MAGPGETAANLAELLSLRRQEIAESWAERMVQMPGSHFRTVPVDDLRGEVLQGLDALIATLTTHSDESMDKLVLDICRLRLPMGFDIGEIIEGVLVGKEIIAPLLWRSFVPGSAQQAAEKLDEYFRHVTGRFGYIYAGMMQRQVREQRQRTDLMLDAANQASGSQEPAQALQDLAEWLRTAADAPSCEIYLLDSEHGILPAQIEPEHLKAIDGAGSEKRMLNPALLPVVRDALTRNYLRVAAIPDIGATNRPGQDVSRGVKTVMVLPLQVDSQMFVVVIMHDDQERLGFSQENVELVRGITKAVTLALENARLYQRTRQHLAESQSLQRVTAALLEKYSLEDVLKIVCTEAQTLTGAKGSAVLLVEQEEWLRTALSTGEAPFGGERLPLDGSFTGMAVRRGELRLSNDLTNEGHWFSRIVYPTSILAVPLRAKETMIGALDVVNKPGGFTDDDVRIMSLFADQAAVAIENARLSQLLEQLAVIEERQRLARDLHDSVTQTLYSVTLYADAAIWSLESGNNAAAVDQMREVQGSSREALREMRLLIFELHPPELEAEGLVAVLQSRLEAVEARAGFKTSFQVEGEQRLPLAVEEALYRIAQEALNNVFKHASAHLVTVALRFSDPVVALEVGDDGIGFDPAAIPSPGGLGLRGMEERARKLGASLEVDSAPGQGTRVRVVVETPNTRS